MAITNAQQYQQLVNKPANGKRPGYRGGRDLGAGASGAGSGRGMGPAGGASSGGNYGGSRNTGGGDSRNQGPAGGASAGGNYGGNVRADNTYGGTRFEDQSYAKTEEGRRAVNEAKRKQELQDFLSTRPEVNMFGFSSFFKKPIQKFSDFTTAKNRKFFQDVIRAGKIPGLNFGMTTEQLEDAYQDYMSSRLGGEIDAYGNPLNTGNDDGDQIIPLMAQAPEEPEEEEPFQRNFRLLADGGMPEDAPVYEGGIMDLESSRQMYGLGKLVKKITRGVKKIAKSPIGKAALLYFGGNALAGGGLKSFLLGSNAGPNFSKTGLLQKMFLKNPSTGFSLGNLSGTAVAGIPAALSYFMTPEEEEQQAMNYGADIDDPKTIMNNPSLYINRRLAAEGGSMDEPVAKKTMPLLDMDGQEMDLRAEGGFVPIGRMEKADDVPARLSKNEFVFTAEAVRNAGEGDVDKGAEVMYNMMKNLESGGEVSEESQGLEGAREMFQTSQRLEEVI